MKVEASEDFDTFFRLHESICDRKSLHVYYPQPAFAAFFSAFGRLNPKVEDEVLEEGKGMRALILCGEDDPIVPIEKVQAGRERLEKFGVEVTFRCDPVGHGASEEMNEYIFQWLSQQAYGTEKPRAER